MGYTIANFIILDEWMHVAFIHTFETRRRMKVFKNGKIMLNHEPYNLGPLRN